MGLIGNLLWLLFGGIFIALEYAVGGIVLCLTIIGFPFGIQCFKLASLALFPFGRDVVNGPSASGCFATILNLVWMFTGGLVIVVTHLLWAFLCAITIIGLPFAAQHMKLAGLALTPFGKIIR